MFWLVWFCFFRRFDVFVRGIWIVSFYSVGCWESRRSLARGGEFGVRLVCSVALGYYGLFSD